MGNKSKVEQYFKDVENVFGTKEGILNLLNNYTLAKVSENTKSLELLNSNVLGINRKEYWVKFEIETPDILNTFLLHWVLSGKSIAGVQVTVLDYGGVVNKQEIKDKLLEFIETL